MRTSEFLDLPSRAVPDRVSLVRVLSPGERFTFAELDGPGCIRHIWTTMNRKIPQVSRKVVIRIYFDGCETPFVEAPVGDFFGSMHGEPFYPIDTPYLSVKSHSGYNCYFPMPFAESARIEYEAGEEETVVYLQADWHRYPDEELIEPKRFCSRWRREMPTQRYGEEFLMLDADGPGQLIGFAYGVRLIDNVDRWSHGGAENIYIDGEGEHPVFIRGIGGEDTFGTSYGGAVHEPETHLYAGMPYYVHEDVGEARPAQRLVGYRFFIEDSITFDQSLHLRFGCMQNDICATTWWYQEGEVRLFVNLPDWKQMMPGVELPRGECDLPLPASGEWWLCGPFGNDGGRAMNEELIPEREYNAYHIHFGMHVEESLWQTEGSKEAGKDSARWVKRPALHGFVDFNHVFRPHARGVSPSWGGAAVARCVLRASKKTKARLRLAWDDSLILTVNGQRHDLGHHAAFRAKSIDVELNEGENTIILKLSNEKGSNHGGWAFAFLATGPDGEVLRPEAEQESTQP